MQYTHTYPYTHTRTHTHTQRMIPVLLPLALALCAAAAAATSAALAPLVLNVTVFSKGEAGYKCLKIPYLLSTQKGTLLAFAEARGRFGPYGCQDWSATDLVVKRSEDGGATWSSLAIVYSNSSQNQLSVVGNAAPVQLPSGRVLLPFCLNNSLTLQTFSDDDGRTWAAPVDFTGQVALSPPWAWIGIGPPAGLRLSSGASS